jgi:hypothetical protein
MKRWFVLWACILLILLPAACGVRQEGGGKGSPISTGEGSGKESPISAGDGSAQRMALYPAQVSFLVEGKWGYIDDTGKFALSPVYSSARRFQANGLAVAGRDGKVGLIDPSGKFVVQPVYQDIGDFSDGLAIVMDEGGFSVMDSRGNILSEKYPFIGKYKEGRAPYYIAAQGGGLLYGYLGENGKTAIVPAYQSAGDFDGGIAVVELANNHSAIIDRSGKILRELKYSYVGSASDGMLPFVPDQNTGRYGYLDSKGEVAIKPAFITAQDFMDGAAVVDASSDYTTHKMGLIDKKGAYLIKPQYNDILQLGEDRAAVGVAADPKNIFAGSRYALATREGTLLSDFSFYGMEPFAQGVASVYDNFSTYFIDKQGKRADSLPAVEGIGTLELLDGLIYADIDQRPFYLNRKGETVYRPESSVTLKSGVKVSEERYRPNRNYLVHYPALSDLKDLKVQENINAKLRNMWIDKGIKPEDNLDYSYTGEFKIGFNRKNLLELEKSAYDYPFGAAHGMPVMQYAHVDTRTGAFYQLEDLFKDGSDYVKVLSDILRKQINEHGEEMGVWPDSYKGIKPDQPFFLSGDALMLYFEPYEIAPYAAGFPTFTVPFTEIADIIDKTGSFWRSFN